MVEFNKMFDNFLFAGLMVFSLIAYGVTFQADNNVADPLIEDTVIGDTYDQLSETLGKTRDQAQSQLNLFQSENPLVSFGELILFSIIALGNITGGIAIAVFNSIIALPTIVFGLDPIVVGVLGSLFLISLIIAAYKLYRGVQ